MPLVLSTTQPGETGLTRPLEVLPLPLPLPLLPPPVPTALRALASALAPERIVDAPSTAATTAGCSQTSKTR